jgi:hypothetical protein
MASRFLYCHDPLTKTNCHQYIDNHPHILAVVRLANQRVVAAYSEDPISPNVYASKGGLLISVTD